MKTETITNINQERNERNLRKAKRIYRICSITAVICLSLATMVFATDTGSSGTNEALSVLGNLSSFIFSIIRIVGVILAGWGVVQFGMSFQSHDPTQKSTGVLCFVGGLIICFTKEILAAIGVSF